MKLLIYVQKITPRVNYLMGLIFRDLLGLEYALTDQKEEFQVHDGPRFSYGQDPLGDELFIRSNGLLFETGITEKPVEFITFNGQPAFFATSDSRSLYPFDLFDAAFFLVSRYEEYLPFKQDEYGRFPVIESTASKGGFLRTPLVNHWVAHFSSILKEKFPGIVFKERKYKFVATIDIDHAYAYKHRNLFRTIGGMGRSILRRRWKQLGQRIKVLLGMMKDPYDTYEYIHHTHKQFGLHALFFVLYSQSRRHDNNITLSSKAFKHLIKSLSHRASVGIHPSLGSNKRFSKLEAEVTGLAQILGKMISITRQHFLKVSFPKTYQNLINVGLKHDYSLGYASEPGFKASIADPFRFYNLVNESETNLIVHPITVMDVTLRDYYRLDAASAVELTRGIIDTVREVNGEFVNLWHNESFAETGRWKGWRQVYEEILEYGCQGERKR